MDVKPLLLLPDFNPNQNMPTNFGKDSKYVISRKPSLWRDELCHAEGRMNIAFGKYYAKLPKNCLIFQTVILWHTEPVGWTDVTTT